MHNREAFARWFFCFAATAFAGICWLDTGVVVAETPGKTWQWRAIATSELAVAHSVLLQDSLGGDLRRRQLTGPSGLLMSTSSDACFCGYAFDPRPADEPAGRIRLHLEGVAEPVTVVVGPPEAALLPAQLLRDGPPSGEPSQIVFERRKVLAVEQGQAGDLAAVFLPVEYRHHFERLLPPENQTGFVVRQKAEAASADRFGIVDDLGTNKVTLHDSQQGIILVEQFEVNRPQKTD